MPLQSTTHLCGALKWQFPVTPCRRTPYKRILLYVISVNLEVPSDFSDYTFTITTKPPNLIAVATNLLGGNGGAVKLLCEL